MPVTHRDTGTRIDEIEDGIYRVSTPVPPGPALPAGFSFNQFLILDEESLLFHTGPRRMFPLVREAIATVLPPHRLRYIAFSHVEGDECGSLREWLDAAPGAAPVCSRVAAMVHTEDATDRPTRALADGDVLSLGRRRVRWFDSPHVPHGWDCGYLGELSTTTLFCGDLFTQAGADLPSITESEILGASEEMRAAMDYFAHGPGTRPALERLAAFERACSRACTERPTAATARLTCARSPTHWRGKGSQPAGTEWGSPRRPGPLRSRASTSGSCAGRGIARVIASRAQPVESVDVLVGERADGHTECPPGDVAASVGRC